jgi:hypothetical protein
VKAGVLIVAVCSLLAGCNSGPGVRLAGMQAYRPERPSAKVRTIAVSQLALSWAPGDADTVAHLVSALLRDEYGYAVRDRGWTGALRGIRSAEGGNPECDLMQCLRESEACRSALLADSVDIVLVGSRYPYNDKSGYWVLGVDSHTGRAVLSAATEGPTRSWVKNQRGEWVSQAGLPLSEHAQVLASSVDWQLAHPGETPGRFRRLDREQPWTKLLTNEDKRELLKGHRR